MFNWMRLRLMRPFGGGGVTFQTGENPTVHVPRHNRIVRVPFGGPASEKWRAGRPVG